MEWKFSRAVVADEYRRYHPIVVPFNIITYPVSQCYITIHGDSEAKVCRSWIYCLQKLYIFNRSVVADKYVLRQNLQLNSAKTFFNLG